jgi:hypothetical protein
MLRFGGVFGLQPHDRKKGFNEAQQRLSEQEQAERKKQLEKTMALLVHASSCQNQQCPSTNCNKVKALFAHAIQCGRSITGGCQLCRYEVVLLTGMSRVVVLVYVLGHESCLRLVFLLGVSRTC